MGGVQLWVPKVTNLMTLHLLKDRANKAGKENAAHFTSSPRVDQNRQLSVLPDRQPAPPDYTWITRARQVPLAIALAYDHV